MPSPIESLDLRTRDGWSLRADVHVPAEKPLGVAVLAHAIMARRTSFYRPREANLTDYLVERGWQVVAFDFRGHGDSGPSPARTARSGYDELVVGDLSAVCEFAREQADGARPVVVIGHCLGGHAALVAQGIGAIRVDAIAGIAAAPPFLRAHEPLFGRWLAKYTAMSAMESIARARGRFPARAMRFGSDDTSRDCCEDFARCARTGEWRSRDGRVDYLASLANVRIPVLQVLSEADRFECVPVCGERFVACCSGPREVVRVVCGDDGGPPPGHMGLVTSARSKGVWKCIELWMRTARVRSA